MTPIQTTNGKKVEKSEMKHQAWSHCLSNIFNIKKNNNNNEHIINIDYVDSDPANVTDSIVGSYFMTPEDKNSEINLKQLHSW